MKFHLERDLRLQTAPEYSTLYQWAINEIDASGQKVNGDQIPWIWSLNFTASSCLLADSIEIGSLLQDEAGAASYRQAIVLQLRPGLPRDDKNYLRKISYSMFGTERELSDFQLVIAQVTGLEKERCRAWGSVSYTSEGSDFIDETTADVIVFHLYVKQATFEDWAKKIALGNINEIFFRAGRIDGFYSDWSPSIVTNRVKIMTAGGEHQIDLPPDIDFTPPRLGNVGEAALYINRRIAFGQQAGEVNLAEEQLNAQAETPARDIDFSETTDHRSLEIIASYRKYFQLISALLFIIIVRSFF